MNSSNENRRVCQDRGPGVQGSGFRIQPNAVCQNAGHDLKLDSQSVPTGHCPLVTGHCRPYTLLELVVGFGVLILLFTAFQTSISLLNKMDKDFSLETRSVLALGNIVERLKTYDSVPLSRVKSLVAEEMARSGLSNEPCECLEKDGMIEVRVQNGKGHLVASVKMPMVSAKKAEESVQ